MMPPIIGLALALALPAQQAPAARPDGERWVHYTAKDAGFAVDLPGRPFDKKARLGTKLGPTLLTTIIADLGPTVFLVSYNDYPPAIEVGEPAEILARAQAGVIRNVRGTLIEQRAFKVDGAPAREFEFTLPEGASAPMTQGRGRVILDKKRLYQLLILTRQPDAIVARDAERFFDSFQLPREKSKPKPKPETAPEDRPAVAPGGRGR